MGDSLHFPRDCTDLLRWLDAAPEGTLLRADVIAERIRQLPTVVRKETESEYLTAAEAATYLNMSEKFVYANRISLGGRQFGSAVRFSRRAVERYARRAS